MSVYSFGTSTDFFLTATSVSHIRCTHEKHDANGAMRLKLISLAEQLDDCVLCRRRLHS